MPSLLKLLLGEIIVVLIIFPVLQYFGLYTNFWHASFSTFFLGYLIVEGIELLINFIRDKFNRW
jgi:hypothetical protein